MNQTIELCLDTFGDITDGPDGKPLSAAQVIRNLVEEAVLADEVGVDAIGVGEHHRADFAVSAPDIVLAAIAARTERILLGSAVTVLSSDDPIRVFQRFSTIDAISNGRAEVILGRGSFIESFPLFGFDLNKYEELFNEKLDLFAAVLKEQPVTWQGALRPPLKDQSVYPKTESGRLTTWIGVGGTEQSAVRAAQYGMPMMLAIIGGSPARFAPYSQLYRERLEKFGKPPQPIGAHSPGHVAETDEQAMREARPHMEAMFNDFMFMTPEMLFPPGYLTPEALSAVMAAKLGMTGKGRSTIEDLVAQRRILVGSPETVRAFLEQAYEEIRFGHLLPLLHFGTLPADLTRANIELFAAEVMAPLRQRLGVGEARRMAVPA
jgi:probable LLM family oxidoreductase